MRKLCIILPFVLIAGMLCACSSDENDDLTNGVNMTVKGTIDFYGTPVPYTPIDEQDFPVWLRKLKSEKNMMSLYRICVGTINNMIVYHLNLWTDSALIGRIYDKDGNLIDYKCSFEEFKDKICNVRCIYYIMLTQ